MLNKLKTISQQLSPNLRKILGNISWLLAERVLRMGVGFFVIAWIARYLGAAQFGLLNYALAFADIFGNISRLGLNQIIVRDLVNETSKKEEILGTALLLRLVSGISTFVLASGAIFVLRPEDTLSQTLVVIVAARLILQPLDVIEQWFQSQVQSKYVVWARNTAFLMVTLVRVILLQYNAPLTAFAATFWAESTLSLIGLVIVYKISGQTIRTWYGKWGRAKQLMKVSWPLIFSSLAIVIYLRVDQVMLGQLADDRATGIYSAAVRLSEVWPFMALTIVQSFSPTIIAAKKTSEKLYYQKIQQISNLLILIVYAIAIPMTFLSTFLVVFVFGENYAAAGTVLSIHIWSSVFVFLGYVKGVWIATEELTKFAFVASSLGALFNIFLNWLLIPIYQEVGAALATVISYGFTDYCMCWLYPPARKMGLVMTKAICLNGLTTIRRKTH